MVDESFPGPKTRAALERGIPLFKNGLRFDAEMERAGQRGFRPVRQIVIDKAQGDFVWAISDREDTICLYPALNMDESVLRKGLQIMEDAIQHVGEHGHVEGDTAAFASGVAGF